MTLVAALTHSRPSKPSCSRAGFSSTDRDLNRLGLDARLDFLHHFVRDRDLGEQVTKNVQVFRRSESKHGPGPPVVVRVT
jgi:hypothetical protein